MIHAALRKEAGAENLPRGGIVGRVTLADCRLGADGIYRFHLIKPKRMRFVAVTGRLGFFEVPDKLLRRVRRVRKA